MAGAPNAQRCVGDPQQTLDSAPPGPRRKSEIRIWGFVLSSTPGGSVSPPGLPIDCPNSAFGVCYPRRLWCLTTESGHFRHLLEGTGDGMEETALRGLGVSRGRWRLREQARQTVRIAAR